MANAEEKKITINPLSMNLFGVFLITFLFISSSALFAFLTGRPVTLYYLANEIRQKIAVFFVVFISFILLHEIIHGLFFRIFSGKGKSVKFGFTAKALAFYCHCSEPLKRWQFCVALLSHCVILGIIPLALSFRFIDVTLMYIGDTFIGASAGDILCFIKLLGIPPQSLVVDDEHDVGFRIIN